MHLERGRVPEKREKGMRMISKHLRKLVKAREREWQRRWTKIGKRGRVERNDNLEMD
jgi:hypothetical protein